jgi:hypothetical protein
VSRRLICAAGLVLTAAVAYPGADRDSRGVVADRIARLTRHSVWRPVSATPIAFDIHHPQGLVRIGDSFFVSSVEIRIPTKPAPEGARYDRDAGEGVGHLFKVDARGNRVASVRLGSGAIYHPGGIDYDGRFIWVPVAEYRPDSRSIVYRVDPATMRVEEALRFEDHLGAVAYDTDRAELTAVSWGSRRLYRWTADGAVVRTRNPSHYVDYQDCKYAGAGRMWCTGVASLERPGAVVFRLGGLDLISLADGRALHQVPIPLWTAAGLDMTHNATWLEPAANGLRGYFLPEDGRATVYVYDVDTR